MPQLQLHMLRVAAVAQQICDNLEAKVSQENIITACLFHDMGNIVKFDLKRFPEFLEPEGLEYWQEVKNETELKYQTNDAHTANLKITKEIGLRREVINLIDKIGFKYVSDSKDSNLAIQICTYSDMRVGPHGILTLEERLEDGRKRYENHADFDILKSEQHFKDLQSIEDYIFSLSKIKPSDITDESSQPIIEQLKAYEI